jgi:hypothetical protein
MGRNVYEVIGYADISGSCFCPAHAEQAKADNLPIFLGNETDYVLCCDICREPLDTTVLATQGATA